MSRVEQFAFQCRLAVREEQELLHLEVRSRRFPEECYSQHFAYEQLPRNLRLIFQNIAQIFVFLQRKELVYFDEQESALKLCPTIAGEVKEFPIPLAPVTPSKAASQKIAHFQAEMAKKRQEFEMSKLEKEEEIGELRKHWQKAKKERSAQEETVRLLQAQCLRIDAQLAQMKLECQSRMQMARKMNPKETYNRVPGLKQLKRREQRREFWIKEIGNIKSPKLMCLKEYINKDVDFDAQVSLSINAIRLTRMQFVEVFSNLQVLDLSRNHIASFQGLDGLKQMLKLNLNDNKITSLNGLPHLPALVQLHLKSNSIRRFQNLFHLSRLQILNLSCNFIQSIPDDISKLSRLIQLRLYGNRISAISEKLLLLPKIRILSIMKNKCYTHGSRSRQLIDKMMKNGVQTALAQAQEILIE